MFRHAEILSEQDVFFGEGNFEQFSPIWPCLHPYDCKNLQSTKCCEAVVFWMQICEKKRTSTCNMQEQENSQAETSLIKLT